MLVKKENDIKENDIIEISKSGTRARINTANMQLFSLIREYSDVMWKGGAPEKYRPDKGWQNSEIVMFPIIGSVNKNEIHVNGRSFRMYKNGIARDLPWKILGQVGQDRVAMIQTYSANTKVRNSKGEISVFPRSYTLIKSYSIDDNGKLHFTLELENKSDEPLPYSIGWQPAFITKEEYSGISAYGNNELTDLVGFQQLEGVRLVAGKIIPFINTIAVSYHNDTFDITLRHNFGWGAQVWYKGEGFVAIDPLSKNPPKLLRGEKARFIAEIEVK